MKNISIEGTEKSIEKFSVFKINENLLFCRENTQQFLQALHAAKIPVLVLSAGMGNLVEEVLRLNSVNYPNLKVIANFMEFDEAGVLKGFSDPVV